MDVQLVMLRALTGMGARTQEVPLRVGDVLGARVLRGGALLLAGVRPQATLPPGLEPGALVRLKVREAGAERLLLPPLHPPRPQADRAAGAPPAAPAPPQTLPVPPPRRAG